MPAIEKHPAGTFSWVELATTDQSAAKTFYAGLLGWSATDVPMGEGASSTIFGLDGRQTGGAFTLRSEERAVPPHWQLYIAVENADQAAARAAELGATTIHAPFDLQNLGRMAVFQDPAGAFFSVWQAGEHRGVGVAGEPGALCWADMQTADRGEATKFYGALFGWEFTTGRDKDPEGYLHIRNGEQLIGGMPPSRSLPPGVPPHWLAYFQVTDCDGATARAQELGGRVMVHPMQIEGAGRFSVLADPQGAVFAVFAPGH